MSNDHATLELSETLGIEETGEGRADLCLHERFERQAMRTPDRVALVSQGQQLSYYQLDLRANQLARHLRRIGVTPNQIVGLHTERGIETVVGILGILKAGATYLPLDPVYPSDRIDFMLEDSQVGVVVADKSLIANLNSDRVSVITPDAYCNESGNNLSTISTINDLAYIIYTSGSTGKPKGVAITHHNVARLFESTDAWFGFNESDVWTLFHSYSFDFSVWEIWGALLYGGRIVIVPSAVSRSAEDFRALLVRERVTVLNQTPSAFRQLIQADMAQPAADYALRYVIFGGEALEFQSLRPWFARYGDARPQLVNMYGITETTVHVTYRPIREVDLSLGQGSVIGKPIPDLQLHILDEGMKPVPVGAEGEMYVGGAGVAKGYLNRPDLTAQRFLSDPFSDRIGARLYRTGDLARRLETGDIEYLGRMDHQVKIRGFRIELGEIESAIAGYPGVRDVAVIAREDTPGDKRIVAYLVADMAGVNLAQVMRVHLAATLPEYMIPAHFVVLGTLPLTANGKIDQKALPAPDLMQNSAEYVAPRTPREAVLAQIWADVLGLERIGINDNFFELGGHSLLVIDVIQRLRAAGLHVDVSQLFLTPTIAQIAAFATDDCHDIEVPPNGIPVGCDTITPAMLPLVDLSADSIAHIIAAVPGGAENIQDIYPLTPLQEGMLFHHRTATEGDTYLVTTVFGADSRDQLTDYVVALQRVIDRHDILRTMFLWQGLPEPVQVVCRAAALIVEDVSLDAADGDITAQLLQRFDPAQYQIDLQQAPAIRIFIAHDAANDQWVMLRVHHHLIEDHTTDELMSEEIIQCLNGQADTLAAPLPFRDFVFRSKQMAQSDTHRDFFQGVLRDVDEPTMPFGFTDLLGKGRVIREARQLVDPALAKRLRKVAHQNRVSAASVFHLAWAKVVAQCSGRDDVIFGTVLFGRMHAGQSAERVLGPFINTLPLRIGLSGQSVEDGLQQTHRRMAELLRHEHASLAVAQTCSGLPANTPLFSALLNFRHLKIKGAPSEALDHAMSAAVTKMGLRLLKFEERTNYPLQLSVDDLGDGFILEAQVRAPVTPQSICGYVHTALEGLVAALEQTPTVALHEIDILSQAERQQLLVGWNDTARDYDGLATLHGLIEARVVQDPDAIALEFEGAELSYGALNARANQLARRLRQAGVGPEVVVGVFLDRSFDMVVALLAVLKSGGAYMPLDPSYPAERLLHMIEDSAATLVLAQPHLASQLPKAAGLMVIDPSHAASVGEGDANLVPVGTAQNLAYVIFTSGSTGRPKGAMNEHRGICNRLFWMQEEYGLTADDRVLQKTQFSFDVSVWEFFWPLMVGARMVIARPDGHRDSAYLVDLIRNSRVTTLHFVPSMLRPFLEQDLRDCGSLKRVMCSGEALPHELQERFFAQLPDAALHNLYGPTETAVDVTYWPCQRGDARNTVPIGWPVANTQMYVLDGRMQPVPAGALGEIYIGGVQVGRGYLGRDDLTAERFLADPFVNRVGARLYKTGDRGKHLADGAIEYLGRADFQVKIRGQRVELGEIEAALDRHPQVSQTVAMVREDDPGDQRLVAYVVTRGGHPEVASLREHLSQLVPSHMVPSAFVLLDALPLTSSGKVDRRALPVPGYSGPQTDYVAPRTPREAEIAAIWAAILKLDHVGIHDNFFELGGHSLLALSVIERMRRAGLQADVRTLFSKPTVAAMADAIGGDSTVVEVPPNGIPFGCDHITPEMLPLAQLTAEQISLIVQAVPGGAANVQDIYPLAPLQEGFLFHHRITSEGDLYIMVTQFAFDSRERLDHYLEALQWVIGRHDIMRSLFIWEGLDGPVQIVCRDAPLLVTEVTLDAADGDIAGQLADKFNLLNYRFDMQVPPMVRVFVAYDPSKDKWIYHQLTHHMMDDQATVNIQEEEIEAYLLGKTDQLPAPSPFRNYVAQARLGLPLADHEAYFRDMLSDVEEPTAPFGFDDVLGNGSSIIEARKFVDPALSARLFKAAQRLGVSTASVFHEAFALMLARLSGRDDVVFGTVLLGRMLGGEGAGRVVGPCINTLPIRVRLADFAVRQAIQHTHTQLINLLRHEHAPLGFVQRCSGVGANIPVFNSILNYRRPSRGVGKASFQSQYDLATGLNGDADRDQTISEWFSENIPGREFLGFLERTNYPLTLSVDDFGEGFRLVAQVQSSVDPANICTYMHTALEALTTALEQAPERPLRDLGILSLAERHRLLVELNATDTDFPADLSVQALIEAQTRRTPARTAVRFDANALSYAELDARANQFARYLKALGIGRANRVGLCIERNVDLPAVVLGVLKAGAAYVPLDPAFPADRLRYMAQDADLSLLVTVASAAGKFDVAPDRVLLLDADWFSSGANDEHSAGGIQVTGTIPEDPAYISYTSGSTGRPKGVVVPHRAVVNMLASMQREPGIGSDDVLLAVTTLSFDISVLELLLPLSVGATVAIASRDDVTDVRLLAGLMDRYGATIMQATPVTWQQLISTGWAPKRAFKALVGGESLSVELAEGLIGRGVELWNMYGPTETTVWSTCCRVIGPTLIITIGAPIANTTAYILDAQRNLCPVGVPGELCIGGAGVALGYWDRADLSVERFVANPFVTDAESKLYRTGDRARWTDDGSLEHLGRMDFQVKIRGHRLELGDIEASIKRDPAISDAVVVLREDLPGDSRLVAYLVPHKPQPGLTDQVRASLRKALPDYMMPQAFVILERLPLTPNAKIDRRALPAPMDTGLSRKTQSLPTTRVEQDLAEVWQRLLRIDRVGIDDDFFELGGHSLLALDMLVKFEQSCKLRIPVRTLMEERTIRKIALSLGSVAAHVLPDGITCVQQGSSARGMFCMPGLGGVSLQYQQLTTKLHTDRSIYAIELHDFDVAAPVLQSLKLTAMAVVERMRQVQPKGPYSVLGYSFGGNLAVEVAAEIARQGEQVEHVFVIDAYGPGVVVRTETLKARIGRNLRQLSKMGARDLLEYVEGHLRRRMGPAFVGLLPGTKLQRRIMVTAAMGRRAFLSYTPSHFDGRIVVVRADKVEDWLRVTDASGTCGWGSICGKVDVVSMACDHLALFREPHLSELGAHIDRLIGRQV